MTRPKWFLGYSRTERSFIEHLSTGLRAAGIDCICDLDIPPGISWVQALERALADADGYMLLVGKHSPTGWVRAELDYALRLHVVRARQQRPFLVVPLLLDEAPQCIDGFLGNFEWIRLAEVGLRESSQGSSSTFGELAQRLQSLGSLGRPQETQEQVCPFPGLGHFDERSAQLFFGRDSDVRALCEELGQGTTKQGVPAHRRWLLIEGPSGVGKSSLVLAGLLPAIRRGWVGEMPNDVRISVCRPGHRALSNLAKAVFDAVWLSEAPHDSLREFESLKAAFVSSSAALASYLEIHRRDGSAVVLVIDQLEELFTLAGQAEANQAAALLAEALHNNDLPFYLITTIRSDFVGSLGALDALRPLLNDESVLWCHRLAPMDMGALRLAIEMPATMTGLIWDGGLVDRILEDAQVSEGSLPLVAHVLRALWSRRTREGVLTHAAYQELGCVGGALTESADRVVESLGAARREKLRRLFVKLVRPGRGTKDVRQTISRRDGLQILGGDEVEATTVLGKLAGGRAPNEPIVDAGSVRLLYMSGDGDDGRIDIIHEALLEKWKTLREWIDADRKELERTDDLEAATRAWEAAGTPTDGLPAGGQLAYFEGARDQSEKARAFLEAAENADASRRIREHEQTQEKLRSAKRNAQRLGLLALGLCGALAFAIVQYFEVKKQSKIAETQTQKAAAAEYRERGGQAAVLASQPGRGLEALFLRLETMSFPSANPAMAPPEVVEGLVQVFTAARRVVKLRVDDAKIMKESWPKYASFSPDGKRIVVPYDDTLRIWDTKTGALLRTLEGAAIYGSIVAFSPTGKHIVTTGKGNDAQIWDGNDGRMLRSLTGHTNSITALAFSTDGNKLVTGSYDRTVRLWDANTDQFDVVAQCEEDSKHTLGGAVYSVAISPDASLIAFGCGSGAVHLVPAIASGTSFKLSGHTNSVKAIAFTPSVMYDTEADLATCGEDGAVLLWNTAEKRQVGACEGLAGSINAIAYSHNGARLAIAGERGTGWICDPRVDSRGRTMGQLLATLQGHSAVIGDSGSVNAIAFSPDGSRIGTASSDRTVRLWHGYSGKELAVLPSKSYLDNVIFSPDGDRVAIMGHLGVAEIWDARVGKPLIQFDTECGHVERLAYSEDGKWLFTYSDVNSVEPCDASRIWDVESGARITNKDNALEVTRQVNANHYSIARENPLMARVELIIDRVEMPRIIGATDGKTIAVLEKDPGFIYENAFSRDGKLLATASHSGDFHITGARVCLWDATTGKFMLELPNYDQYIGAIEFSPDGRRIVTAGHDNTALIWNVTDGARIATLKGATDNIGVVAYSPDGTRLVTVVGYSSSDGDLRAQLWDGDGNPIATVNENGGAHNVRVVAFSPNSSYLVTGSDDGTARQWDARTGKLLKRYEAHDKPIRALAISPDGNRIATGSEDGTARLWDVASGKPMGTLPGVKGAIAALAFSPDGRHIAVGGGNITTEGSPISTDGVVRIYPATAEGFLIQACQYISDLPDFARAKGTCEPYLGRKP